MSWIGRLLSPAPDRDAELACLRFVIVDVETSGLDPHRDRLLAIGAVALERSLIRLGDSYHALLRQERTSSHENILVHGIGGTSQVTAPAAAEGLAGFLQFAGNAPLVAFHADFDRAAIDRAMRETLGVQVKNPWLDVAVLAPALIPGHESARTLDDWMSVLGIENFRRHDAVADALATAQIFQMVLARSIAAGRTQLSDLVATAGEQRWLARHGP